MGGIVVENRLRAGFGLAQIIRLFGGFGL